MPGITTFRKLTRKTKQPPTSRRSQVKQPAQKGTRPARQREQSPQQPQSGLSVKFRLNDKNPKEKKIIDALAACGEREMSRFIKRAAYQLATGRDYDTGLPLLGPVMSVENSADERPASHSVDMQRRMSILADLDAGLSDWDSLSA